MRIDITPGRGRISVGPPGGPTETIPASVTVTITDTSPYDGTGWPGAALVAGVARDRASLRDRRLPTMTAGVSEG